jgi:rfaE bifunctional protein nucleotidyltransferase chain/domain
MEYLELIKSKILDQAALNRTLAFWRFKNWKIVFTNGCFDILHPGHINYLAKARSLGNVLIIGLNTDESVKRIKGENRPVLDQNSRATILSSLLFVDGVVFFNDDTPKRLIDQIQPDILVKGGDYRPDDIVGADIVRAKGGEVITINLVEGFSTSSVIKKLAGSGNLNF